MLQWFAIMNNKIKAALIPVILVTTILGNPFSSSEDPALEIITPVVIPEKVTLAPALKRVCSCESTGRPDREPTQFEADGVTVLRGRINNQDIGMCQVNLKYHKVSADKLGLDLFTEEGNIKYANWLYKNEGLTPWNWSRACWG